MSQNSEYAFDACMKINGWAIDANGRTRELQWRCWKIQDAFNTREKSFKTRAEAIEYAKAHE